jgi:hypothetical protein
LKSLLDKPWIFQNFSNFVGGNLCISLIWMAPNVWDDGLE